MAGRLQSAAAAGLCVMTNRPPTAPAPRVTGAMSLVDDRRARGLRSGPNRLGILWVVFGAVVTVCAMVRMPTRAVILGAAAAWIVKSALHVLLVRLAARDDDGFWDQVRCVSHGPITLAAILTTGGIASPVWLWSFPAVMGSTRERKSTSLIVTIFLIACHVTGYVSVGMGPGDWATAASRAALLLTASVFFRIIFEVEHEHRRIAEEAARSAERARTSQVEAQSRFQLAEQAATHSKMASLGLLAASVAHEINNPINTIINSSQIILDGDAKRLAGGPERFHKLIISEAERIARVVSNLLQFARGSGDQYGPTALGRVIEKTLMLIHYQLDKDSIEVVLDIPAELPMIRGRMEDLQQVFLNLFTNARYAILERKCVEPDLRPEILITARLSAEYPDMLNVQVRDNGCGIAASHVTRIFEPFFTTKPKEEGTGLGLSVCHRILKEHGGAINVASVPGRETTFSLDMPAITEAGLVNTTGVAWTAVVS